MEYCMRCSYRMMMMMMIMYSNSMSFHNRTRQRVPSVIVANFEVKIM